MVRLALRVLVTALALAPAAAGGGGIKPIAPKQGDTVRAGKSATFKLRVRGNGPVFVHVCESPRRDARGLICDEPWAGKARRKSGNRFEHRARLYDYPEFWLNQPGTYYWQAYRVACDGGLKDCRIEGPVVKFKVG
jgi:hypothetical protein